MVSKKIRNLIIGIGLLYMLTFGNFIAKAAGLNGQYILPQSSITYVQKLDKVDKVENVQSVKSVQTIGKTTITYNKSIIKSNGKKILIYHSHYCEKNESMSVYQMGELLTKDLEAKGYTVTHLSDDFSGEHGYNQSYFSSRAKLKSLDLSQFSLCIDEHVDAGNAPTITQVKGSDVARVEWVQTKNNPNLTSETNIANGVDKNLSKFGNISKGVLSLYFRGITFYNADLNPNMNLIEMGNNCNTYDQVKLSSHYLAESINSYIMNK